MENFQADDSSKQKNVPADRLWNHTSSALKGRVSNKYPPEVAAGVVTLFWADLFDTEGLKETLRMISATDTRASFNKTYDILFMHYFKTESSRHCLRELHELSSSHFHIAAQGKVKR